MEMTPIIMTLGNVYQAEFRIAMRIWAANGQRLLASIFREAEMIATANAATNSTTNRNVPMNAEESSLSMCFRAR
jgi:hypothetical protein